jgi:hypothetical protein
MLRPHLFVALALLLSSRAFGQFTPAFLQNNSYWGNGKAEFNIYEAHEVRYGQARPSEVLHILVRDDVNSFALPDRQLVVYTALISYCKNPEDHFGK